MCNWKVRVKIVFIQSIVSKSLSGFMSVLSKNAFKVCLLKQTYKWKHFKGLNKKYIIHCGINLTQLPFEKSRLKPQSLLHCVSYVFITIKSSFINYYNEKCDGRYDRKENKQSTAPNSNWPMMSVFLLSHNLQNYFLRLFFSNVNACVKPLPCWCDKPKYREEKIINLTVN